MAEHPTVSIEDVRRFWNANPLFAGESRFEPGSREFFEEHLRITLLEHSGRVAPIFVKDIGPGTRVLDVGCGIGFWVGQFCARGASVTACDLAHSAVDITRRRVEMYGFQADVRVANAERLPFPDSSFDHVNCQGVIHHTPDTAACIREFARVLRPGGTACFSVYFRSLPLRSHVLFRTATTLLGGVIRLRGRGRESMMQAATPEELVRMYDGADNPLGKSYRYDELEALTVPWFSLLESARFALPRRVFPVGIPDSLHRILSRRFGLMIAVRCRKTGSE